MAPGGNKAAPNPAEAAAPNRSVANVRQKLAKYRELAAKYPTPKRNGTWGENARLVIEKRLATKGPDGKVIETPEEMCWRVALYTSTAEADFGAADEQILEVASAVYDLMIKQEAYPNSPTLTNAGKEDNLSLAACFVLPIGDSMESIFEAVKNAALIHKAGGGVGYSFSRLRPQGARVRSTGGVSSGPVSFMKVFGAATESVKQGGTRRGANMGVLSIRHPDILEFIECKSGANRNKALTNFNISVDVDDAFMEALEQGEDYDLIDPQTGQPCGRLNSVDVWQRIVQGAWESGDPGVLFFDAINRANKTPHISKMEATNPCGEQPLLPYEACNLGSINVAKFVKMENGRKAVDVERLGRVARLMVRFLDNVIQTSYYPLPEITEMVYGNRKIGVGVMGYADLLIDLGVPYDSAEALEIAELVMRTIQQSAKDASAELAGERGEFPNWKGSVYDQRGDRKYRNSDVTTIAPTGTIGIIAEASGGIEPVFAIAYTRTMAEGHKLPVVHPKFIEVAKLDGFYSEDLIRRVAEQGSVHGIPEVPAHWQRVFVTAHDVTPEWHVRTQAAFQKWTDNAVSKTCNFPREATPEDIDRVYRLAFKLGCKGVTVFRDGCLDSQVLTVGTSTDQVQVVVKERANAFGAGKAAEQSAHAVAPAGGSEAGAPRPGSITRKIEKPAVRFGRTTTIQTPLGNMDLTVNEIAPGVPFEVFVTIGRAGSDITADAEAIGRLVSLALQCGIHVSLIAKQLKGIGGAGSVGFGASRVTSIADAIGKYLEETYVLNGASGVEEKGTEVASICPSCGVAAFIREVGCTTCRNCGFSQC